MSQKRKVYIIPKDDQLVLTMAKPKFEVFKDQSNEYRFRLKAPNGEIIATSEGYTAKASCLNGIESIKKNAPIAEIVELE